MTAIYTSFMDIHHQVVYQSPKRKRGPDLDSATTRLITSGFRRTSDASESIEAHSPSARVTGRFQRLRLHSPVETSHTTGDTVESVMGGGGRGDDDASAPEKRQREKEAQTQPPQQQPQQKQSPPPPTTTSSTSSPDSLIAATPPQASMFTFESKLDFSAAATSPRRLGSSSGSGSSSSSSSTGLTTPSDQFWQANEITGWSPDDPDEDNYGVNGVGYHKTPALAYSLSQRRKQQIADYRSRETKEARQRRGERRLNKGSSRGVRHSVDGVLTDSTVEERTLGKKVARLVRFNDG